MTTRKKQREKRKEKKQVEEGVVQYFDYSLLAIVIFLMCFGLVMLYSTSSYRAQIKYGDSMYFFKRQALISLASVFVMLVVAKINYHWYAKRSKILYIVAFVLMALVLTPLGIEVYGARKVDQTAAWAADAAFRSDEDRNYPIYPIPDLSGGKQGETTKGGA